MSEPRSLTPPAELQPAIRGPRPEMYAHSTMDCFGQFHYDGEDFVYRCIACDEERPFWAWGDRR